VSRIFWAGVGAAGGIYAYRKATRAVDDVRGRTFRENVSAVARAASNVAASARYLASLSGEGAAGEVVDLREDQWAPGREEYYPPRRRWCPPSN